MTEITAKARPDECADDNFSWRGCMPLELCNHGSTPIEIVVGARLVQVRLFEIGEANAYSDPNSPRKYHGNVRPTVSRARHDDDLARLVRAREQD